MVNMPLEDLVLEAGTINRKKLDEKTFIDCHDNNTNNLFIELRSEDGRRLPADFFISVKQSKPERPWALISNPLDKDTGDYVLKLEGTNTQGLYNSIDFSVTVLKSTLSEIPPNHELSMTLDTDYDDFMSDLENRLELSNKVANIFGVRNSRDLVVTRLERGSVVYAWTNQAVSPGCPIDELSEMVGKMFSDDGSLTMEAKEALAPYTVNSAAAEPKGSCEGNPKFPRRAMMKDKPTTPAPKTTAKPVDPDTPDVVVVPKTTPKKVEESTTLGVAAAGAGSGGGSDIWITTVVPAIIVVVVLIIALVIACCLYRRKRKGKMKLEEKNEFSTNKGVPVIFADEYEEKPNDSTRPLIMSDEKPPMPPPEYQRASSETSGNSGSTAAAEEIELEDTSEMSPLYTPPPPVTASTHSKPPHVHSSRGPPPFVPP